MSDGGWMDLRCPNPRCHGLRLRKDGTMSNPKLILKFMGGGLNRHGQVEAMCPICNTMARARFDNQHGDDTMTFPSGYFQTLRQRHPALVTASLAHTSS